jgi:hypothetical protein
MPGAHRPLAKGLLETLRQDLRPEGIDPVSALIPESQDLLLAFIGGPVFHCGPAASRHWQG